MGTGMEELYRKDEFLKDEVYRNKKTSVGLKLSSLKTSFLAAVQVWTESCQHTS